MSELLKTLRAKYGQLVTDARAIRDRVTTESRELTDDEYAEVNTLLTEADSVRADYEAEERTINAEAWGNEPVNDPTDGTRQTQDPGTPEGTATPDGFRSLGEFLCSVAQAGTPNGFEDPRLREVGADGTRAIGGTGANVTNNSEGGYLLNPTFTDELFKRTFEVGQLASRCRSITMSSKELVMRTIDTDSRATGSRWGGIRGYWEREAETVTASQLKFGQFRLNLRKLIGITYATEEILQDAPALGGMLSQGFTEEFAFLLDDAILNGDGAVQPKGILNAGSLVTVAKETGQTAATIVKENIDKMWNRCYAPSRANAAWFINQEVEPQLDQLVMPVGTGGSPVYLPAGGLSASPYSSLKGRPVVPVEQCAALGTVGDIILANLNQYILARRGGINSQASIHVRFLYGETTFRFTMYVDGDTPWSAALTPYKGSNTYSPFVALATRA